MSRHPKLTRWGDRIESFSHWLVALGLILTAILSATVLGLVGFLWVLQQIKGF